MLIEILIALLVGVLFGTFTGLIPSIHINLIGVALVSGTFSFLSGISPIYLVVLIASMSIAHVFLDFIPSIFLGAPEDGTELSVLPGHEMLKRGLGFQAVYLSSLGCLYGVCIFLLMIFPLYLITKVINVALIQRIIPFLLILISLNLILMEKKRFAALFVFLLSGILGLIVLNMDLKEPLLPLLTGLFGASGILLSIKSKTKIRGQKTGELIKIKKLKPILVSVLFSPLSIFVPALSSGQIAVVGNQFFNLDRKGFLFSLGLINSLAMSFSFLALFLISRTRTGSAVAVKELLGVLNGNVFALISAVILVSGIASFFIVGFLAKRFLLVLEKVNYASVSVFILLIISATTLLISGFFGFLVLVVSAFTGIYCISLGVNRINMMACLLLPTIILYLF